MASKAAAGFVMAGRNTARAETAFAEMMERQARLMFRVAHTVLRNRQDAEDAVQEALLKMYRLGGWEAATKERAYVTRAVWRVAVDRVRLQRRGQESSMEEADGRMVEGVATEMTAEEGISREGERVRLRRLIEGLPEELRQPLLLCAFEEMTSREVAEVMGLAEGTVRTRVMRAKAELRRRFAAVAERRR